MEREHGSTGNALTHLWGVSTMKKPSAHGMGARERGKRVGSASTMKKLSAHGTGQREHGDRDALRHVEKVVSTRDGATGTWETDAGTTKSVITRDGDTGNANEQAS